MLVYGKLFFIKTIPEWTATAYAGVKKSFAKLTFILTSWEAWSIKKLVRHSARFIATFLARTLLLTFLINLFFGLERKGLKNLPGFVLLKLKNSWVGVIIDWWGNASDRAKRIITGIILCLFLAAIGQAFIGISILVFDLVWECLITLWRITIRAWRWIYPIIIRLIPNTIGSFVTNKLLPFIVSAVPIIRDDIRVIFVRYNIREKYRDYRKRLLKFSRAKRPAVRASITPLVSNKIRREKSNLIKKILNHNKPMKPEE